MPTPYEKIYANLLPKFRNYDIPVMSEEEVKEMLHDYLVPATAKFHVCKKDLTDRNDILERFNCELSDMEIEIISNYMLIDFTDSEYIQTPMLLKVSLSSTDFNAFSPANMLDKLMSMHRTLLAENETLLARYAWMGAHDKMRSFSLGYKKKQD